MANKSIDQNPIIWQRKYRLPDCVIDAVRDDVRGKYGLHVRVTYSNRKKVTVPEGYSQREIAKFLLEATRRHYGFKGNPSNRMAYYTWCKQNPGQEPPCNDADFIELAEAFGYPIAA